MFGKPLYLVTCFVTLSSPYVVDGLWYDVLIAWWCICDVWITLRHSCMFYVDYCSSTGLVIYWAYEAHSLTIFQFSGTSWGETRLSHGVGRMIPSRGWLQDVYVVHLFEVFYLWRVVIYVEISVISSWDKACCLLWCWFSVDVPVSRG